MAMRKEDVGQGPTTFGGGGGGGAAGGGARPSELNALLGKGSSFEGKLLFEGSVRIDGKFTGEIVSTDTLIIGEGADVKGAESPGQGARHAHHGVDRDRARRLLRRQLQDGLERRRVLHGDATTPAARKAAASPLERGIAEVPQPSPRIAEMIRSSSAWDA